MFTRRRGDETASIGVAIGDDILDLRSCCESGLLDPLDDDIIHPLTSPSLNRFAQLGRGASTSVRAHVSALLAADNPELRDDAAKRRLVLVPQSEVDMHLPFVIGDYTDFYASAYHAFNVGSMFRPDQPLLPNYKYLPVAYHGRSSSVIVSGSEIRRPWGQAILKDGDVPEFVLSRQLDYELELGFFVGHGNVLGDRVAIENAGNHIFGICLVNDWSARDIQRWEYQPLGPFLGKNFATSVSPWVVTMEALAPFRTAAQARPEGDPAPLPHLFSESDQLNGGLSVNLEVAIRTQQMRQQGLEPHPISDSNFRDMYWTAAQMLAHHTSNGCNLRPGDLFASGTVSGPEKRARGCLLELTWRGTEPLDLPTGEARRFLEDGDEIILRGRCASDHAVSIGLGACRGQIVPAR